MEEDILSRLHAATPGERPRVLAALLSARLTRSLGIGADVSIDPRKNLMDLGMDSLRAVDFKIGLEESLKCALPTTLLFDYPTVESLSSYLVSNVLAARPPPPQSRPA